MTLSKSGYSIGLYGIPRMQCFFFRGRLSVKGGKNGPKCGKGDILKCIHLYSAFLVKFCPKIFRLRRVFNSFRRFSERNDFYKILFIDFTFIKIYFYIFLKKNEQKEAQV